MDRRGATVLSIQYVDCVFFYSTPGTVLVPKARFSLPEQVLQYVNTGNLTYNRGGNDMEFPRYSTSSTYCMYLFTTDFISTGSL